MHRESGKCLRLLYQEERLQIWDCDEADDSQLFGFMRFDNDHRIFVKATMMCMAVENDPWNWVNVFMQRPCADDIDQKIRLSECRGQEGPQWSMCSRILVSSPCIYSAQRSTQVNRRL